MKAQRLLAGALVVGLLMSLAGTGQLPTHVAAKPAHPLAPLSGNEASSGPAPASAGRVSADWWAAVQENIRKSEYHATWQEQTYLSDVPAAYQAPNRAHNLRTYFTPAGIRVVPRVFEGETPPWEWGLTLRGLGYAGEVQPVTAATLHSQANRIEYRRGDPLTNLGLALNKVKGQALTEWYVNDEHGLEQGFTLHAAPLPGGEGPLVLELALGGDLTPHLTDDGGAIEFTTAGGVRVLRYGGLAVYDATGRHLPAHLELGRHTIRILFDATAALYPITVDPLATSPAWTAEGNQDNAYFGYSVGTAGDVDGDGYSDVIVGAYLYDNGQTDEGQAYLYHGDAAGLSAAPAWTVDGDQAGAYFGYSVGTAGDVDGDGYSDVIVGAYWYNNGEAKEGQAYVYHGSGDGLSVTPAWTADGDQADARFGYSVGTAGDVNGDGYSDVIVGAHWADGGQTSEGRALVYLGGATGLGASPAWTAEGDQDWAHFGASVGTAGDVNGDGYDDVVVGAPDYTDDQTQQGRAYVYLGSAAGLSLTAHWTAESDQADAFFGSSVATAGDVNGDGYSDLVVGAPFYDNGQTDEGRAYVYHGGADGPGASPAWTAEGNQAGLLWGVSFGISVGTAGDVNGDGYCDVIVGASLYSNGETYEGRAFVYHGGAGGLSAIADWTAESDQAAAMFAAAVATAGDVNGDGYSDVIVGAPEYDHGQAGEGRAFVYHGGAGGLSPTAGWMAKGNQNNANFGVSVGTAGDVNGDGYSDVVVGARYYDNGQAGEGRAFVYHGGATGPGANPAWTAESDQAFALFGSSVGTAGDVNGDGYSDVVVGAPWYDGAQTDGGRAYVYCGGATGLGATPPWTAESDQPGAAFGRSVGTAGDVNGDGYSDVVVGAPEYDNGQAEEGRAFVYHGGADGLSVAPTWTAGCDQAEAYFGVSVGTAGDVNGDGYSDVIVGACLYGNGQAGEGRAFVYHGDTTGLSANPAWTAEGNQADARFGTSVGTAGDVNGDGYSDVVVGAPWYDGGQTDEGRAFAYHGSATGLRASPAWMAESNQAGAVFGYSLGTAGDVNGDGYSDVIIGAYLYDNGQASEGRAYAYHGGPGGLGTVSAWSAESDQANARLGYSVGMAGDVNGDGYGDVVAGAYLYDAGSTDEGRAYVYFGNGIGGFHMRPRQLRRDGSTPIAHLGMSDDSTAFRLSLIGRMPLGREDVKLQWQVASLGVPFSDPAVIEGASPAWIDTGTGGVVVNQIVAGLAPGTPYHWRVRLLYRPGNAVGQPASRWVHIPWAGWHETDLRTATRMRVYLPLVVKNH